MTIITKKAGRPAIGLLAVLVALAYILTGCPPESGDDSTPTVNAVIVTAAGGAGSVPKGGSLRFSATVIGTNDPDQEVEWSIDTLGTKPGTIIEGGLLTVAAAETNEFITVKATSVADRNRNGSAHVGVTFTRVTIDPKTAVTVARKAPGNTKQFTAVPSNVEWEVIGGVGRENGVDGTSIHRTGGLLTVAPHETAETLTVKATSVTDPENFDTVIVTVSDETIVNGVTVTSDFQVKDLETGGWTLKFFAKVEGLNNPSQEVTWSVAGQNGANTAIRREVDSNDGTVYGLLKVDSGETAQTLTVIATSDQDPDKHGVAIVTVSIKGPTVKFVINYPINSSTVYKFDQTVPLGNLVSKPDDPNPTLPDDPNPTFPSDPTAYPSNYIGELKYYTFDGWFRKKERAEQTNETKWNFTSDKVTLDKIIAQQNPKEESNTLFLYAKWTPITYTITYEENGATAIPDKTYNVTSSPITLPKPERKDYLFKGWFKEANCNEPTFIGNAVLDTITPGTSPEKWHESISLYAKWVPSGDSAIVYYWVNEGTLRLSVSEFTLGGNRLTIAPQGIDYSDHTWYVNGVKNDPDDPDDFPDDSLGDGTYTFDGASRETGKRYTVGLRVRKNDQYYYAETSIRIQ